MEPKSYTIIGLSVLLLVSLGFSAMPDSTHKCDSRELKAYCFDISPTRKTCYTLPNYTGGKRCTEGWKELNIETNGLQFLCNNINCTIIK